MFIIESILIFSIGLLSGAYGIIVGAGGGFILIPSLLLIMNMSPAMAAGTGLTVVMINAFSGVFSLIKHKRIDYHLSLYILIGTLPGSFIGFSLIEKISTNVFYVAFATVLIILGIFLLWKSRGKETLVSERKPNIELSTKIKISLVLVGIVMGTVSTFFGIGGGWLLVPILIYLFKSTSHRATATSIFTLGLYSVIGVIIYFINGYIDWSVTLFAGTGALIGAQIGVFISNRITGRLIIQLLSVLLIVMGITMVY